MFPFPPDPLHLFDKPLLNHPETNALSFPPSKLDHASPSPLLPLSPLIFDHPELLNDINLHAAPPQISPPPPPPLSSTPDKPSSSRKNTKPSPRSTAFSCDLDKCGAGPAKNVDGGGGAGSRRLRKDRHSKIHTAQGPRDRRMRLSLDVARKFFDLQDTLGFDKASKTVDWLLNSCKSSIMELSGSSSPTHHLALDAAGNGAAKSESSTSECEVISTGTNHAPTAERAKRVTTRRPSRDAATHPPPSRESRQMARARARERTKEKMMLTRRVQFEESGDLKRQPASSLSLFEAGDESGTLTHTTKTSWELATEEGQVSSCSPVQHKKGSTVYPPLAIGGGFAPISVFDYDQRAVHNGDCISFTGEQYWDIRPSDNAEEQRLTFADAQLHQPFLWEAFNPRI